MKDQSKTKQVLIQEVLSLRQRISELEQSESNISRHTQSEDLVPLLNQRLYLLIETIQKLARVRDLEGIMGVVRSAARALVGADGSTFVLREGDQCFYADEDAISPLWKGHRFPMSMCISGWVMINHQIAVIDDIYADPRIPAEAYRPTFVKSLTMVPIRSRDPLGAIGNYWAYLHSPTSEEVQLLQTLADATAIAMENVRLYNEQKQHLTERKQAEEILRRSEERFKNLYQESPIPTFTWQKKGDDFILVDYNNAALQMTSGKVADILGNSAVEMYIDRPQVLNDMNLCFQERSVVRQEIVSHQFAPGRFLTVSYGFIPPDLIIVHTEDQTVRRQAEEKIHASLQEKEILLNEIHHRVKNNLQVMSSLLKLQAMASKNPELIESFHKNQSRIQSMALVHEKLYAAKDFTRIELVSYARTLSQELFLLHKINPGKIDLIIKTDGEIYLNVNKAIPCGLILNELISNALKHAFPGEGHGELEVVISETKDIEIEIIVRDNGLGLPDDVDIHAPRSLGLDLVNGLVTKQLYGQIEVRRDKGTEFRITFPL